MSPRRLWTDEKGSVLVEATVMMAILLLFVLGSIDFLFAFYQCNAAAKAVQLGARIAVVSDPVADGLNALSVNAVSAGSVAGADPMPAFTVTCDGNATSCTCSGFCTGLGAFNQTALNTIVYGQGNTGSCSSANSPGPPIYFAGMCTMYPGLTPANVKIVYRQPAADVSGTNTMGYAGRPGGPVPTVEVSLQGLNFVYYFLNGLMGFGPKQLPPTSSAPTTTTGEVLSSCAQDFTGPTGPGC